MEFGLDKSAKVTSKKGTLAVSENIPLDINWEANELENSKTYNIQELMKQIISSTMNKEKKMRKWLFRRIRFLLRKN